MGYTSTRLRSLSDKKLKVVERMIDSLPYKVEIKGVNFVDANWYIHFTLLDDASEPDVINQKLSHDKQFNKRSK